MNLAERVLVKGAEAGFDFEEVDGSVEGDERFGYVEGDLLCYGAERAGLCVGWCFGGGGGVGCGCGCRGGGFAAPVGEDEGVVICECADGVAEGLADVCCCGWGFREELYYAGGRKAEEDGDETLPKGFVAYTRQSVLDNVVVVVAKAHDEHKRCTTHDGGLGVLRWHENAQPHEDEDHDGRHGGEPIGVTRPGAGANVPGHHAEDAAKHGAQAAADDGKGEVGHVHEQAGLGADDAPDALFAVEEACRVRDRGRDGGGNGDNDHAQGVHACWAGEP